MVAGNIGGIPISPIGVVAAKCRSNPTTVGGILTCRALNAIGHAAGKCPEILSRQHLARACRPMNLQNIAVSGDSRASCAASSGYRIATDKRMRATKTNDP